MSNVFNSVKGLKPVMRSYSAHSYRNDLTQAGGVIVPVYQQHVTAKTRVLLTTHALVRTQPLLAPLMDNIEYFVHFWQIPYRLLENDKFTEFISGELEDISVYNGNGWFFSPFDLCNMFVDVVGDTYFIEFFGDCSLFDYLGYDKSIFGINDDNTEFNKSTASKVEINWRPLIAYFMLMLHWYMNENIPYNDSFINLCKGCLKNGVRDSSTASEYHGFSSDFAELITIFFDLNRSGSDDQPSALVNLAPHGFIKDYFTSALPMVQVGDAAGLPIDISGIASLGKPNITLQGIGESFPGGSQNTVHISLTNEEAAVVSDSGELKASGQVAQRPVIDKYLYFEDGNGDIYPVRDIHDVKMIGSNGGNVTANVRMVDAGMITINELRFANALQVFKERQLRYGRRRLEYYKGFFDVTPEDLRLQVPRFLGGGRLPINISDVEQTSQTTESSAQGTLAGKGSAVAGGFAGFNTFCSEETVIIGLAFIMPKNSYANGISRFLLKTNDIYDYFNPSFQHLGEQAIYRMELYANAVQPLEEFGYTPRYNEYRFHANEVHGSFKSSLSYWNLSRIFGSAPALNADFIYIKPWYFDRIFTYAGKDPFNVSLHFSVRLLQPVSKYGTPMLIS